MVGEVENGDPPNCVTTDEFNLQGLTATVPQFRSWFSIAALLLIMCLFRSIAAPFFNPKGEPRIQLSSSFYFSFMAIMYCWVVSSTALTVIPHFSAHHRNEIVAASLFFPMTFASVAALLMGRFAVRFAYYVSSRSRMAKPVVERTAEYLRNGFVTGADTAKSLADISQRLFEFDGRSSPDDGGGSPCDDGTASTEERSVDRENLAFHEETPGSVAGKTAVEAPFSMVPFHRPFRRLIKSAASLSAGLCFLYAHCWSQELGAFKVYEVDGSGAVCKAVFWPFSSGDGKVIDDGKEGVDESCIWLIWGSVVLTYLYGYAQEEFKGDGHKRKSMSSNSQGPESNYDFIDDEFSVEENDNQEDDVVNSFERLKIWALAFNQGDVPKDTLQMVPWYSVLLVYSVFDILVQLKVFLGRYDARSMQPALQKTRKSNNYDDKHHTNNQDPDAIDHDDDDDIESLFPGCVFDCREMDQPQDGSGFWFDFMADCGDGFDSSYQISRTLAQPSITVVNKETHSTEVLPRGSFLVVGGDLAYPDPCEESYEKRFFRTFEDAMVRAAILKQTHILHVTCLGGFG